ncbi:hypothetical protein CO2235_MP130164 [Cupriavidus oxalaticus]|uniref:Uncharacterized protein n=1 Tax=Cupriavidus oxalaticus TaxID=96344 RepID=A0A976GCJ4_9BURK|nr:hypothetical protein CO2235_MP130164 [Cupriavidus oxalaticus]
MNRRAAAWPAEPCGRVMAALACPASQGEVRAVCYQSSYDIAQIAAERILAEASGYIERIPGGKRRFVAPFFASLGGDTG